MGFLANFNIKIERITKENKKELIEFIKNERNQEFDDFDYETPMHLDLCLEHIESNNVFFIFRDEIGKKELQRSY